MRGYERWKLVEILQPTCHTRVGLSEGQTLREGPWSRRTGQGPVGLYQDNDGNSVRRPDYQYNGESHLVGLQSSGLNFGTVGAEPSQPGELKLVRWRWESNPQIPARDYTVYKTGGLANAHLHRNPCSSF